MFLLDGREYWNRFKTVSNLIDRDSSVVELCCGFGDFYNYALKRKNIDYLGVDLSPEFVRYGAKRGVNIILQDVTNFNFPVSDYYVMFSSLYHFQPNPEDLIKKMLFTARKKVIIVEPIKNLLNSEYKVISRLALSLTNEGGGKNNFRFTEESLRGLMDSYFKKNIINISRTKNGKEIIYILKPKGN
jgi:SAM-dependent methyltransferase